MINRHYPARDRQSHTANEVYTGVCFDHSLGCESTGVTTGRRVKMTPHPIHFVYRSIIILIFILFILFTACRLLIYHLLSQRVIVCILMCLMSLQSNKL